MVCFVGWFSLLFFLGDFCMLFGCLVVEMKVLFEVVISFMGLGFFLLSEGEMDFSFFFFIFICCLNMICSCFFCFLIRNCSVRWIWSNKWFSVS